MAVAKYVYVILSNPVEGREDEYNDWYTNTHLADVKRLGFTSAQRFRLADMPQPTDHKYLAIYEVETDDIEAVSASLVKAAGTPALLLSDAMDFGTLQTWFFEAITERV
jgi:hypothetical protein